ncbi:MAG: PstS family phosphate ABC transporter substrate-binding protein [Magnetococcales bacterium]|nr:PstS family phosphate ABC transporter substrate-binding protein [Magnetococcales bacterium]
MPRNLPSPNPGSLSGSARNPVAASVGRIALGLCASLLLGLCAGLPDQLRAEEDSTLRVIRHRGEEAMVPLTRSWAEAYRTVDPGVVIKVQGGDARTGIAGVINGHAEVVSTSLLLLPREEALVRKRTGQEPVMVPVGRDRLAVVVHADNPLPETDFAGLAGIFGEQGTIRTWGQLGVEVPGCREGKIAVYGGPPGSGSREYFATRVLGTGGELRCDLVVLGHDLWVVAEVARDPCGIAFSGAGEVMGGIRELPLARPEVGETSPPAGSTAGEYPLTRPLFVIALGTATAEVRRYLDWLQTPDAQELVRRAGFLPWVTETGGEPVGLPAPPVDPAPVAPP